LSLSQGLSLFLFSPFFLSLAGSNPLGGEKKGKVSHFLKEFKAYYPEELLKSPPKKSIFFSFSIPIIISHRTLMSQPLDTFSLSKYFSYRFSRKKEDKESQSDHW
jgi:hypothetical protein